VGGTHRRPGCFGEEKILFLLLEIKPMFIGRQVSSLVTVPTELSLVCVGRIALIFRLHSPCIIAEVSVLAL
jgi:hypothetical protein